MFYCLNWTCLNKSLGCDGAALPGISASSNITGLTNAATRVLAAALAARWAILRPTPRLRHPPPTTSDFSQSPKYLGIFRRCWQHNRSTPCTQQTCIPCEEQQAPLNSWAIWSHLKPQILKQKTSLFYYYYYYLFCKLIKALELKGKPQKNPYPLKQIFATDTRWRRQVFFRGRTEQPSSGPDRNWSGFTHK